MAVIYISSRDFRSHQADIFDLADRGEKIIIHRRKKKSYMLVPISYEDLELSEAATQRLEESRQEYKEGNFESVSTKEDLKKLLEKL
jgi:antitoxin (DNA-binding transcriptional repressor) of toxin-antitoxin stability system